MNPADARLDDPAMPLKAFSRIALPAVERAMLDTLARAHTEQTAPLHEMLVYHLGLDIEAGTGGSRGKRIRPLLVLLCCGAAHGEPDGWRRAIPAAAAVELLHNFSLIHDDIQDRSETRRGRPTVWVRWGIPQAINAGDAMYTLAYRALLDLRDRTGAETALVAQEVLQDACLALTAGQFLDLDFETRMEVSLDEYWTMIGGKTAALLAACAELGALSAGAAGARRTAFRDFGRSLGLAFQAHDDLLGIWGEESRTGKSAAGDLAAGKKSLPILFGLAQGGEFARRWRQGPIRVDEAPAMARLLEGEGALRFTQEQVGLKTAEAMNSMKAAAPEGAPGELLFILANDLTRRRE